MSVYRQAMLGNVQLLQGEQTARLSAPRETNTVLEVQAAAKLNIQMLRMKQGCFNIDATGVTSAAIECFHSRGQHLCKFIGTKESVYIRKEFISHRIGLGHQHGRRFIVLGHQYGRQDVMWKHSIPHERISSEVKANTSEDPKELPTATHADAGKKAQNTTWAARKTGDGIFLRKLKDILGVQEADKRFSHALQGL